MSSSIVCCLRTSNTLNRAFAEFMAVLGKNAPARKGFPGDLPDTDPLKTGVQESAWAKNLGNAGCIPSVDEVYQALQNSIAAKALATAFD